MYTVDKRSHKHRKLMKRIAALSAVLSFVGIAYVLLHLQVQPTQELHNSPPVSQKYHVSSPQSTLIDTKLFSVQLPAGWKAWAYPVSPIEPQYAYRSPSAQAQEFDMYVDNPPTTLGLNRAIVVAMVDGGKITHDSVSENCITYTDASKRNPQTGLAPAKWQGIDFYCDAANSSRALVGAISKDGLNQLVVTTPKNGTHKIFITYTDNNISPDYNVLYDILNSLTFK